MAHGAQVVNLVGLGGKDRLDKGCLIGEVGLNDVDEWEVGFESFTSRIALAPKEAEDLVSLRMEELGEVPTVLTRDARDQGPS